VEPLGTHDMFLSDILAVTVREELLDESGRLCLERAHLLAYSHGAYFSLGKKLGQFGFSAAKRRPHPKGGR
jgi:flavin reductase (DIM6/NTAB) family NADH-FMN oxidoreductase RutF